MLAGVFGSWMVDSWRWHGSLRKCGEEGGAEASPFTAMRNSLKSLRIARSGLAEKGIFVRVGWGAAAEEADGSFF